MDGRKKISYFLFLIIVSLSTFTSCKTSKYSGVSFYVVDNPYTEVDITTLADTLEVKSEIKEIEIDNVVTAPQQTITDSIVLVKKEINHLLLNKSDSLVSISKSPDSDRNAKLLKGDSIQGKGLNNTLKIKNDSINLLKKELKAFKASKVAAVQADSLKKTIAAKKDSVTLIQKDSGTVQIPKIVAPEKGTAQADSLKKVVALKTDTNTQMIPLLETAINDSLKKTFNEKIDSVSILKKELEILKASKEKAVVDSKIKNVPTAKTDSVSLLQKKPKAAGTNLAKVKSSTPVSSIEPVINTDKLKSDSIRYLQREIDYLKLSKSNTPAETKPVAREVMVPIVASSPGTRSQSTYIDPRSSNLAPVVQQNQATMNELTKELENLKSKYNDLENDQLNNKTALVVSEDQTDFNLKLDRIEKLLSRIEKSEDSKLIEQPTNTTNYVIPKLNNKADTIQFFLNKIEELNARTTASETKKHQAEEINKLTSNYKKTLDAKADSIKHLSAQLQSVNEDLKTLEITDKKDTILFVAYYNSGSLVPRNKSAMMDEMKTILEANKVEKIHLAGYTDISGSPKINQKLSLQRVNLIKQDLISIGYNDKFIFIQSWGSKYASPEKKENERRVEIMILVQ